MFDHSNGSFRDVPKTGVIYVMSKAHEPGFSYQDNSWATGPGAPETGAGEESVLNADFVDAGNSEYSLLRVRRLRQQVAELYNNRFRQGQKSQYT